MIMEEQAVKEELGAMEASAVNEGLVKDRRETSCSRILCWTLRFRRGVVSASIWKSILAAANLEVMGMYRSHGKTVSKSNDVGSRSDVVMEVYRWEC